MFTKGKIPFVRFLMPLIAGISIGYVYQGKLIMDALPVVLFLQLLFFVLFLIFYKHGNLFRKKWLLGLQLHCFFLFIGYYSTINSSGRFDERHFSNQSGECLIVKVNNEPKYSNGILRFEAGVLKVIRKKNISRVTGKLLIAIKTDSVKPLKLSYGQMFIIPFHITEVDPPYNPAEFNYKKYLANHQIYHQTFINQGQIVSLPASAPNLVGFAIELRKSLVVKFQKYLRDPQAASLASTLILGYKSDLSKDVVDAYSKTGTLHVLSVSGMHVGIVFFVLAFLLKPLNRTQHLRLLKAFIIILIIWFYALITDFSPSVCRAAVMLSFVVLGKAINRNQNTYNLIAISAFVLLLYNPWYLFDVGFQLSYLAVLGLVFLHPKIYNAIYNKYWLPDQIWSYCALSLAAQLATFPISLYYFHQFPVYFLISNLLIVLPVIFIMYAGILFLFIPWPIILEPLGTLLNSTIYMTNAALFYIEHLPFSTINSVWINPFQYLLMYVVAGCMTWAIVTKGSKGIVISFGFLLILCCNISYESLKNRNNNQVIFYSLRKNSAIAYLKGRKAIVLTDLAATDKTVPFSIEPYLNSSEVNEKIYSDFKTDLKNISRKNFIKLGQYRILHLDKSFNKKRFTYTIMVNAVLISDNPDVKIAELNKFINYSDLIIDGTNKNYKIDQWKKEAEKLHIKYHILKKNPAYIVKL